MEGGGEAAEDRATGVPTTDAEAVQRESHMSKLLMTQRKSLFSFVLASLLKGVQLMKTSPELLLQCRSMSTSDVDWILQLGRYAVCRLHRKKGKPAPKFLSNSAALEWREQQLIRGANEQLPGWKMDFCCRYVFPEAAKDLERLEEGDYGGITDPVVLAVLATPLGLEFDSYQALMTHLLLEYKKVYGDCWVVAQTHTPRFPFLGSWVQLQRERRACESFGECALKELSGVTTWALSRQSAAALTSAGLVWDAEQAAAADYPTSVHPEQHNRLQRSPQGFMTVVPSLTRFLRRFVSKGRAIDLYMDLEVLRFSPKRLERVRGDQVLELIENLGSGDKSPAAMQQEDWDCLEKRNKAVVPALRAFRPDGADAHLSPDDFVWLRVWAELTATAADGGALPSEYAQWLREQMAFASATYKLIRYGPARSRNSRTLSRVSFRTMDVNKELIRDVLKQVSSPCSSLLTSPAAAETAVAETAAAVEPVVVEAVAADLTVAAEPVAAEPVAAEPVAAEPVAADVRRGRKIDWVRAESVARQFYALYGHVNAPSGYVGTCLSGETIGLGSWLSRVRKNLRNGVSVPSHILDALNAMGFVADGSKARALYMDSFKKTVCEIMAKLGSMRRLTASELAWMEHIQQAFLNTLSAKDNADVTYTPVLLHARELRVLTDADFPTEPPLAASTVANWKRFVKELAVYKAKHGNLDVPRDCKVRAYQLGRRLFDMAEHRRKELAVGRRLDDTDRLSQFQLNMLASMGVDLATHGLVSVDAEETDAEEADAEEADVFKVVEPVGGLVDNLGDVEEEELVDAPADKNGDEPSMSPVSGKTTLPQLTKLTVGSDMSVSTVLNILGESLVNFASVPEDTAVVAEEGSDSDLEMLGEQASPVTSVMVMRTLLLITRQSGNYRSRFQRAMQCAVTALLLRGTKSEADSALSFGVLIQRLYDTPPHIRRAAGWDMGGDFRERRASIRSRLRTLLRLGLVSCWRKDQPCLTTAGVEPHEFWSLSVFGVKLTVFAEGDRPLPPATVFYTPKPAPGDAMPYKKRARQSASVEEPAAAVDAGVAEGTAQGTSAAKETAASAAKETQVVLKTWMRKALERHASEVRDMFGRFSVTVAMKRLMVLEALRGLKETGVEQFTREDVCAALGDDICGITSSVAYQVQLNTIGVNMRSLTDVYGDAVFVDAETKKTTRHRVYVFTETALDPLPLPPPQAQGGQKKRKKRRRRRRKVGDADAARVSRAPAAEPGELRASRGGVEAHDDFPASD